MKYAYRIVTALSPEEVERDVSDLLNEGWECQGGLAISISNERETVCTGSQHEDQFPVVEYYGQALIRRTEP